MGYYDISEGELKLAEIGRELASYADNHKTKSLRCSRKLFEKDRKGNAEDDVWNHCLTASEKLTRFGTVWGPKTFDVFTEKEKVLIEAVLRVRKKRHERQKDTGK
jgi:hypothetical protein